MYIFDDAYAHHVVIRGQGFTDYMMLYDEGGLTCSCPDHQRNPYHCKHLCWLLVMRGDANVSAFRGDGRALTDAFLRAWESLKAELDAFAGAFESDQRDCDGEECPICYEPLGRAVDCRRCPQCSKDFHRSCICKSIEVSETCPMCRSDVWGKLSSCSAYKFWT